MSSTPDPTGRPTAPTVIGAPIAGPGLTRAEYRAATRPRHRADRSSRRGRLVALVLVLAVAVALVVVVVDRLSSPVAPAVVETSLAAQVTAPGVPPALPWPATGQAAVAVPAAGLVVRSHAETPVPVASLTKIMTAYVILTDHPLPALPAGGTATAADNGPSITLGPTDVDEYGNDIGLGQSSIAVQAGEVLTERQLLDGLIVHSANNMAGTLARWDAGSIPAFVAKMNAAAAALGLHSTHFVDASGYDPQSVSTAGDILGVAEAAMALPMFAQAVQMPTVNLPVSGSVGTYTPMLGVDGVVGVKSGFTTPAGGCDVMATVHQVGGRPVLVLAAVTGVEGYDALGTAGSEAYALSQAVAAGMVTVPVVAAGEQVGRASAEGHEVPVVAKRSLDVVGWPQQVVTRTVATPLRVTPGAPAGTAVGALRVSLGRQSESAVVATANKLPPPTLLQRLF